MAMLVRSSTAPTRRLACPSYPRRQLFRCLRSRRVSSHTDSRSLWTNHVSDSYALTIRLDQFLKTCGVATGGQAKLLIQAGEVLVNGEVEKRRRKQLTIGDEVTLGDDVFVVAGADDDGE